MLPSVSRIHVQIGAADQARGESCDAIVGLLPRGVGNGSSGAIANSFKDVDDQNPYFGSPVRHSARRPDGSTRVFMIVFHDPASFRKSPNTGHARRNFVCGGEQGRASPFNGNPTACLRNGVALGRSVVADRQMRHTACSMLVHAFAWQKTGCLTAFTPTQERI